MTPISGELFCGLCDIIFVSCKVVCWRLLCCCMNLSAMVSVFVYDE